MNQAIDKTIERKMFFHKTDDAPKTCPSCEQTLVQYYGPYEVATRQGKRLTDEFMMSGKFGYLCPGCATAVIHVPVLADMLYGIPMKPGWQAGPEFTVLGLVNLDAVPPGQDDIPVTDWDPYPLVLFHAVDAPKKKKRPHKPKRRK